MRVHNQEFGEQNKRERALSRKQARRHVLAPFDPERLSSSP